MQNVPKQKIGTHMSVDEVIESFISKRLVEARAISPYYEDLWGNIARLINAGGKRVRPKMTTLAYEAFGGTNNDAIQCVAASQEFLHLSLLVHDDIIDRDYIRYGVDNIVGSYKKEGYKQVKNDDDRLHYSHSAALLAGDLLLSSSYRLISESGFDAELLGRVMTIHSQGIFEVAGGELIDTESAFRPFGEIDARTVALYKTASYTFVAPLLIGATLAGASDEALQSVRLFARNLGIAYQLRDDIIGTFGDEETIGKTTIGDIREGKHTYLVEQFYEFATNEDKIIFELYFGNTKIQKSDLAIVKKLFISSRALASTESAIDLCVTAAKNALSTLNLGDAYKTEFEALITSVTKRDK
jgi:geranylgeranyl diphosphate synthase type II